MYIEDFIHPLVSLCRPPKSRRNEEREMLRLKELRFEKNAKIFFAFFGIFARAISSYLSIFSPLSLLIT